MINSAEQKQSLQDWLDWQETLHPSSIDLGLDRVKAVLLKLLGITAKITHPIQLPATVITVAGTNGKGSTVAILESIYSEAGYRVGSYTSPHILSYNERFKINREVVSDTQLCDSFARIDQARGAISLTYFEFATLAAIDIFLHCQCQIIILEVGLGGRLDAVNIVEPDMPIITTVDIDHQDWLGNDLNSIGLEKAGIYRQNRPAIYGDVNMPESIKHLVAKKNIHLYQFGDAYRVENVQAQGPVNDWQWLSGMGNDPGSNEPQLEMCNLPWPGIRGEIQLNNAANAIMATVLLKDKHPLTLAEIKRGLLNVRISGRFQIVSQHPMVILDVAHNVQSVSQLKSMLSSMVITGKVHAIMGMLKDKDVRRVLEIMQDIVASWRIIELNTSRAMKAEQIKQLLVEINPAKASSIHCFNNFLQAYEDLTHGCDKQLGAAEQMGNDTIIVFGSFYTVAEALKSNLFK